MGQALITAKGEITNSWEDFECTTINKYNNDCSLNKRQKEQYKDLELKIEELYQNNIYDKIYELLLLEYSGHYKYSVVSSWAKSLSYNFSVRYSVIVDTVELESLFQEHLYGLLDGIGEKPLLHGVSFFQNYKSHCFFIAREYSTLICRKKRIGNYRYSSLEKMEEQYGYEPVDENGVTELELDIRCMLGTEYFTEREEAILKAYISDPKITQRELIGIDGTNQLIQIQRAIKSIRNKLSISL